jgi:predicted O-methyltransferase YrrM
MVDNTFFGGAVLEPAGDGRREEGDSAATIRDFNEGLIADDRVEVAMIGVGDGIALSRKR